MNQTTLPLFPGAVAQGHVSMPLGPVPGCMASSHFGMSVLDAKFTLGCGFTASSAAILAILVSSLGGFLGWVSECCIICGHLAWAVTLCTIACIWSWCCCCSVLFSECNGASAILLCFIYTRLGLWVGFAVPELSPCHFCNSFDTWLYFDRI